MSHDFVSHGMVSSAIDWLLCFIHLHDIVSISFLALLFFSLILFALAATTLALEVLAACIVVIINSGSTFDTSHLFVVTSFATCLTGAFDKLFFFLGSFFGTIFFFVGYKIGLRLVRWELGWCRFFRVPGKS
jgi:hypothetical protein